MRLATLEIKSPKTAAERLDGRLAVVGPEGRTALPVPHELAPSLLAAMDSWETVEPRLRELDARLKGGDARGVVDLARERVLAPLPRTWSFVDGSAYIHHIVLVRKARGAEPPADLKTVPLMYQGVSDNLLGPSDDIPLLEEGHGLDFEGEVAVILDRVPMGTRPEDAAGRIRLVTLLNDVSLRDLIPRELAAGFGFFQAKPASSLAPFAVTLDELGPAWRDGRLHGPLRVTYSGKPFGFADAGAMHFSFPELIAHAARTRELSPGTLLGGGTVSNDDESVGSSCLAEVRMIETIKTGAAKTPFMKAGDTVAIEMILDGRSVFGRIDQRVVAATPAAGARRP